jgi:Uncharacterised nucleotidyltransferase
MTETRSKHLHREWSPEFRLALACSRWPLKERDLAEINRLASASLDWQWFKRIIERNQIVPLAYHNLRNALVDERYAGILGTIREAAFSHIGQSMAQAAELVRITKSVVVAGFEAIALKGVSLSALAYGNFTMRNPGDIDLLVSPDHVFAVESILTGLGYKRLEPRAKLTPKRLKHYLRYYKHFTYFSETKAAPLELHWRLFHNIPLLKEAETRLPATMPVKVGSGVVSTLSRDELFLYLVAHGGVHGWPILKWLADIGALLSAMTAEDLHGVARVAAERGLMAELRAALILVDLFLKVDRPVVELPDQPNRIVARIVEMAQRLLTANRYCLDIHRLPPMAMFFYDLSLRSSWRYRSEDIRRSLLFPDDWELIDLPDALFPLYAAVRPVSWILRHLPRLPRRQPGPDSSRRSLPAIR